jgi:hypothetical protein
MLISASTYWIFQVQLVCSLRPEIYFHLPYARKLMAKRCSKYSVCTFKSPCVKGTIFAWRLCQLYLIGEQRCLGHYCATLSIAINHSDFHSLLKSTGFDFVSKEVVLPTIHLPLSISPQLPLTFTCDQVIAFETLSLR